MYCVYEEASSTAPTSRHHEPSSRNLGSPFGWPFEKDYGYFCDHRDKDLFILSNGLFNLISIVGVYLVIVLWFGPRLMKDRKPLEIKNLIRLYNLAMILINAYMIKRTLPVVDNGKSFFNCKGVETLGQRVEENALLTEYFLLSRLADFLDTLWFVLRKKHSHISFLHVFHHSYVPIVAYVATRFIAVIPYTMSFPFVNSGVHVVMYIYYLLATYPSMRKYLWWKKYLTVMQMLQFISILLYNIYGYFYFERVCGKSQIQALYGAVISAGIFLILFHSFYKQAYRINQSIKLRHQQQQQSSPSMPDPSIQHKSSTKDK